MFCNSVLFRSSFVCVAVSNSSWSVTLCENGGNSHSIFLKCLWNEILAPFFHSRKLKSILHWFIIFEFGLRTSAYEFFLELQSWPIRVKMCDIPRAVKIETLSTTTGATTTAYWKQIFCFGHAQKLNNWLQSADVFTLATPHSLFWLSVDNVAVCKVFSPFWFIHRKPQARRNPLGKIYYIYIFCALVFPDPV